MRDCRDHRWPARSDAELIAEIHAAGSGYRVACASRDVEATVPPGPDRHRPGAGGAIDAQEGLRGVQRRKTRPDEKAADRARDLVNRDFTASRPNQLWVPMPEAGDRTGLRGLDA